MQFEFATAGRIVFGSGRAKEIGTIARSFGVRALVVAGRNPKRAAPVVDLVGAQGMQAGIFCVEGEPTVSTISDGIAVARETDAECVIGVGGGSAIDAGKAIAVMASNEGELLDYMEVIGRGRQLMKPSLPYLAVPTTAGTGAEVTRNAVIGSPEHRVKASLRSPYMLPEIALVDPELTRSLPPETTALTGMDALTQLIEPFVSSRANPFTDALCREGIPRIARSIQSAFEEGESLPAREDMALASLFGGLALSNAGLGAVHGFANPIGGMFDAPHGGICAALLPHVMDANLNAVRNRMPGTGTETRFTEIAVMLTGDPAATAPDGVRWIEELVATLKIPSLKSYKVAESDLDEVVSKSRKASSMKGNPLELTPEELREILVRAL